MIYSVTFIMNGLSKQPLFHVCLGCWFWGTTSAASPAAVWLITFMISLKYVKAQCLAPSPLFILQLFHCFTACGCIFHTWLLEFGIIGMQSIDLMGLAPSSFYSHISSLIRDILYVVLTECILKGKRFALKICYQRIIIVFISYVIWLCFRLLSQTNQ